MTHLKHIKIGFFTLILSLPLLSFAQRISNPLGTGDSLFGFLNAIIEALLQLGAVVAVVMVIYAGFMFVTARGEEKKITDAKNAILYTVIGLAILLGARIISDVVANTIANVNSSL